MARRVARSLDVLLGQLNGRFPDRSKASDGGIGDAAHAARVSDHNPDSGGVGRARDFTHDPAHGVDIDRLSDEIAASRDPRIKYCVTPETRVLCADLHWRPISEITVGQSLIAFDEYGPDRKTGVLECTGARMRTAYTESFQVIPKQCYEIITDRGTVTASGDHMWLQADFYQRSYRKWTKVADLVAEDEIQYFADPWEMQTTFDAGWLAGLFASAGRLTKVGKTWTLGIPQREDAVLDRAKDILSVFKIESFIDKSGLNTRNLHIRGDLPELLRFLGTVPTTRLYHKAVHESQLWDGSRINGSWPVATVREVQPVGLREVIAMQTSTRTFIAEGMFSHNCIANNLKAHLAARSPDG
ncbi:MAG: hypothetical protein ACRDTG_26045 [Pseudonocardiaceae bacterium]